MSETTNAKIQNVYGSERATITIKSLLHSRTVVEKEGYVSTGILTHIEGDMMEIELSEFKQFDLGDPVSLTIHSPVGIHRLRSSVIAKASGALAVLFAERSFSGLEERRESPRIDTVVQGSMKHKQSREMTIRDEVVNVEAEESIELVSRNISDSGIAFRLAAGPKLNTGEVIELTLELEAKFRCKAEIVRREELHSGTMYGTRFMALSEQQHRALRAFLIHRQVAAYFQAKQERLGKKG